MEEESFEILEIRKKVCEESIRILSAVPDDDPRKQGALEHYKEQLEHINKRIQAKKEGKPAPIVIGLKTAYLFSKAPDLK